MPKWLFEEPGKPTNVCMNMTNIFINYFPDTTSWYTMLQCYTGSFVVHF